MYVSQINIYPIKSTLAISLDECQMLEYSLLHDREWAIFGDDGQVITARNHPELLDIQCHKEEDKIVLFHQSNRIGSLAPSEPDRMTEDLKIFSYEVHGMVVSEELDVWFSNYLNTSCRLMKINYNKKRPVLQKHGGKPSEVMGFGDQAPLLILSMASMSDLNSRLEKNIGVERFRPNIVVEDCAPYGEDSWDVITIGNCKMRIIQQCERCVFTTIDPVTKQKDPMSEPLRTLSTYRKFDKGGVVFGVHAVPLNEGTVRVGDEIIKN